MVTAMAKEKIQNRGSRERKGRRGKEATRRNLGEDNRKV